MLAVIDAFWKAAEVKRKAERRERTLEKRLPDEVTRLPRVQVGRMYRSNEPFYVHSDYDIKRYFDRVLRPNVEGLGIPKRSAPERRALLAKLKARERETSAELMADRAQLEAEQKKVGLWQAREARCRANTECSELRYAIANQITPETLEGAVAALHFVDRYYRSAQDCEGLGGPYTASLVGRVAGEIARLSRGRRRAAAG